MTPKEKAQERPLGEGHLAIQQAAFWILPH